VRPSVECVGTVRVSLAPSEALALFTPEGERAWVEGWAPTYPAGGASDLGRGLVFEVGKEVGVSVWIVTRFDAAAGGASYAYVLPGRRAVLIDVDVEDTADGDGSMVHVVYRMTSLGVAGDAFVREFDARFDDFLSGWEQDVRRHLATGSQGRSAS
jgi:hypothetical protein